MATLVAGPLDWDRAAVSEQVPGPHWAGEHEIVEAFRSRFPDSSSR